jgi:hypothetical protein
MGIGTWRVAELNEIWLLLVPGGGGGLLAAVCPPRCCGPLNSCPETEQQIRTSYAGKAGNPPGCCPTSSLACALVHFLTRHQHGSRIVSSDLGRGQPVQESRGEHVDLHN